MAIASQISAAELNRIVSGLFVNQTFEVALVNAGGSGYSPESTDDTEFMENEVPDGTGGYTRQIISFTSGDIAPYSDQGVGLETKAAVFEHDGSAQTINFSHVVLLRGQGNIDVISGIATEVPITTTDEKMLDGTYLSVPTFSSGIGEGATLDIVINNEGVNGINDYQISLVQRGRNYEEDDMLEVTPATLVALGACNVDLGSIFVKVNEIRDGGGTIVSASQTATPVILGNGNEAVFYFNNKVFGFSDSDD